MNEPIRTQRWQRRKDARPAELLDAALAEFFEKGFEGARLEDIAARAGVSKGTIYLYFSGKEEIFQALVQSIPEANVARLQELVSDTDVGPDELLQRFLRLVSGLLRDERMVKFPRLIIGAAGRFPKLADIYREHVISRAIEVLKSILDRGVAADVFRPMDTQQAAFAAVSPLLFTAIWRTTFERPADSAIDAEAFSSQHIDTFLRGIRKETSE